MSFTMSKKKGMMKSETMPVKIQLTDHPERICMCSMGSVARPKLNEHVEFCAYTIFFAFIDVHYGIASFPYRLTAQYVPGMSCQTLNIKDFT